MNPVSNVKTLNNDVILKFIIDRKYRWFRHIVLIMFLITSLYTSREVFLEPVNTIVKICFLSILLFLFYINMYQLVPKLLFKDNYLGYFFWLIGLFFAIQLLAFGTKPLVVAYLKPAYIHDDEQNNLFFFSFVFMILMGASAAIKLFQRWVADTRKINELETTTVKSELEHLKKQINPHFLFNTLNNVNVLTQRDPAMASQVLMKLSDFLRYQLYDSIRNTVFLTADIHFLEDFLNLEKIRRDNFEFTITQQGTLSGLEVAPMLFITFVENAVKHSMDAENDSYVRIVFSVVKNVLYFYCQNSKPRLRVTDYRDGGLGLANIKRRLALLYPKEHELTITDEPDTFRVKLMIGL